MPDPRDDYRDCTLSSPLGFRRAIQPDSDRVEKYLWLAAACQTHSSRNDRRGRRVNPHLGNRSQIWIGTDSPGDKRTLSNLERFDIVGDVLCPPFGFPFYQFPFGLPVTSKTLVPAAPWYAIFRFPLTTIASNFANPSGV
jgi:hypothetical protein